MSFFEPNTWYPIETWARKGKKVRCDLWVPTPGGDKPGFRVPHCECSRDGVWRSKFHSTPVEGPSHWMRVEGPQP